MPLPSLTEFSALRGDTRRYRFTVSGIDLTVAGTKLWFTGKDNVLKTDNQATFQKTIGADLIVLSATTADGIIRPADSAGLSDGTPIYCDFQTETPAGVVDTPVRMKITFTADVQQGT